MRTAVVQHDIVFEDASATRAALEPWLARLAPARPDLVVLCEMFATGFTMHPRTQAEDADGPTVAWLRDRSRELDTTIVASLPWRHGDGDFTNRLLAVRDGDVVAHYDKLHPFSHGREADHYRGGDRLVQVRVAGAAVTPLVCYDLRFANVTWAVGPSTDVMVFVANWPAQRREHWTALLRARAIENQCFVVAANRVGTGDGLDYVGDSCVVDPMGRVVAAAAHAPQVLVVDVDPADVTAARERLPFLADRREEHLPIVRA